MILSLLLDAKLTCKMTIVKDGTPISVFNFMFCCLFFFCYYLIGELQLNDIATACPSDRGWSMAGPGTPNQCQILLVPAGPWDG